MPLRLEKYVLILEDVVVFNSYNIAIQDNVMTVTI